MNNREHIEYEEGIGAYLLDALPELEAEVLERHMLRCPDCREQAERLRASVDALPRAVPQIAPPPELKQALMAEVRADARRRTAPRRSPLRAWSRSLAWSAALACAGVLALAGYGVSQLGGSSPGASSVTASVDMQRLPATARAKLEVLDGGKAAILRVAGLPAPAAGRTYEVWVMRDGKFTPITTMSVDRLGGGTAGIPQGTRGAQAVLVTRERAGGAPQPTERPVITATL